MQDIAGKVKLMLITDRPDRASLLYDVCRQVGISIELRRQTPDRRALDCVHRTGSYRGQPLPNVFFFDFTHPDENSIALLHEVAFGKNKSEIPVVVLTSPESQALLDSGAVDGGDAVMFSPTGLNAFVRKMRHENRDRFFKALRTLYQFGPILVRAPRALLCQDSRELVASA